MAALILIILVDLVVVGVLMYYGTKSGSERHTTSTKDTHNVEKTN